jgi:hypothetical protein
MPTEAECIARISTFGHGDLLTLWSQIEAGDTPGWEPGRAFQYLVLRAFQLEGAEVCWPYTVKLEGEQVEQIDGVVYGGGLACLVEMKDQVQRVGIEPIAKLRSQLMRRPAALVGLLFSRSGFTEPARILAGYLAPQSILLWRGDEVRYALAQRGILEGLQRKYRFAVERGLPNFNLIAEEEP